MDINDLNLEDLTAEKNQSIMNKQLKQLFKIHEHVLKNTDIEASFMFNFTTDKHQKDGQCAIFEALLSSDGQLLLNILDSSHMINNIMNLKLQDDIREGLQEMDLSDEEKERLNKLFEDFS